MIPAFSSMSEGHVFLAILFPTVAAASFYVAWRGLNGKRRSWVYAQYVYPPFGPYGIMNNWPFRAASGGIFALMLCVETLLKYTTVSEWSQGWPFICLFLASLPGALLGHVWWPPFLGPGWYRQWQAAGHKGRTLTYTKQELEHAQRLPDGLEKQRLHVDIQACEFALKAVRRHDRRRGKSF